MTMDGGSPPLSKTNSPLLRSSSPSPSVTPSLALGACPALDRSFSTPSEVSTLSSCSRSVSSASDGGLGVNRRRGYMRPQGTAFADSARNRDSVMSLGSIAHMQYYFARTGLLDGKGAQLAKQRKKSGEASVLDLDDKENSDIVHLNDQGMDRDLDADDTWNSMLPPTVSTYKEKPVHSQPLPDINILRRELRESLDDARKALTDIATSSMPESTNEDDAQVTDNQGWYEVQGLHLLDTVTLAIRAARNYYTCHSNPQKLYAIKSERDIRAELYQIMDILKRMANRSFRGGIRSSEQQGISEWVKSIDALLSREAEQERQEQALREQWVWLQGDWNGREREREWLFLKAFDPDPEPLPKWTVLSATAPSAFLDTLRSGMRLVHLHNALVKQSQRRFGEITVYHTDLNKPYRIADNLRYWIKAAELRWEVKLSLNVMDIVYGRGEQTLAEFDAAVLKWSAAVREELTSEWLSPQAAIIILPHFQIEIEDS